jgi:hypothetical protein
MDIFVVFFSPYEKMAGVIPQLGHNRFLPNMFQFIGHSIIRAWDSSVGIAMGYGRDDRGRFPRGAKDISLLHIVHTGS